MSIIKIGPKVQFTTLSNNLINDPALSPEELGVMAYLLSKPEDWIVRPSQLAARFGMGKERAYRILKDLIGKGWIHKDENRTDEGQFSSVEYIVLSEKPYTGKPDTGKPDTENPEPTKEREELKTEPKTKREEAHRKSRIPSTFHLDEKNLEIATSMGIAAGDIATVFEDFVSSAKQHARIYADWRMAWRNWCRNAPRFSQPRMNGASTNGYQGTYRPAEPRKPSLVQLARQRVAELEEREREILGSDSSPSGNGHLRLIP